MSRTPTSLTVSTRLLPAATPAMPTPRQKRPRMRGIAASDFLPAFLVKEIRQSLRSRRFMRTFIGLQLLLQLFTLWAIVQTAGIFNSVEDFPRMDAQGMSVLFWIALILPMLVIPPLSIMAGMGRILKDRSLDLVFMTGLSAWRTVVGIWLAYLAEGVLLTLAALPYLVLRYYLGGVDLVQQLFLFVVLLLGSSLLTAITLGLSTYRPLFVRLVILVLAIALGFLCSGLMIWIVSELDFSQLLEWRWLVFIFVMLPLLGWLSLRLAASHLCPPAESHSAHLRLGTLLLLAIAIVLQWELEFPVVMFFLTFVTPLLTENLCEPFRAIGPLYIKPGAPLATVRRWAGRVLYAGWPAGLNFLLLFYVLLVIFSLMGYYGSRSPGNTGEFYVFPLHLASGQALTIFAAALLHRVRNPHRDPTQGYFGIAFILQLLYMMVVMVISGVIRDDSYGLLYFSPLAGSLRSMADFNHVEGWVTSTYVLYPLTAIIFYFVLSSIARPAWRAIRALEAGQPPPIDTLPLSLNLIEVEEAT